MRQITCMMMTCSSVSSLVQLDFQYRYIYSLYMYIHIYRYTYITAHEVMAPISQCVDTCDVFPHFIAMYFSILLLRNFVFRRFCVWDFFMRFCSLYFMLNQILCWWDLTSWFSTPISRMVDVIVWFHVSGYFYNNLIFFSQLNSSTKYVSC